MSPIAGFVRLRKHQFGRQADFGTKVEATRAYPFSGTPSVDLGWTDPEVDVGSVDPMAAPYRGAIDATASLTAPALAYNDLPLMLSGIFGGAVAPAPGAPPFQEWTHEPASTTVDSIDAFTYEFGDDVTTDWFQLGDGILESLEFAGPEGLGPLTASMSWRFGSVASSGSTDSPDSPAVPTAGLSVATDDTIVYLKDCTLSIADTVAGLGAGVVTDALHSFSLKIAQEVDQKRFANGTKSFDVSAYGRTGRSIELECTFAKTADTVGIGSESDAWMSDTTVPRIIQLLFSSTDTPYGWTVTMPMRYYTRSEGEIGGNTTVVLTAHAYWDPDVNLDSIFQSALINELTEAELGLTGSGS